MNIVAVVMLMMVLASDFIFITNHHLCHFGVFAVEGILLQLGQQSIEFVLVVLLVDYLDM